ncbi:MAG: hypothetical protein EOP54_02435 [Sphingobacteriales bacterium]|nr:MAG: hypothetical protein EOP54_02435 [Sphingobacteriales bacterium]
MKLTLLNLNIRWTLTILTLLSIAVLASCTTAKKATVPATVTVNIPDTIEIYSCGFEPGTYSGTLPCFGDECGESGAPLTTLFLGTKQQLTKTLSKEQQIIKHIPGKWQIREDCIIQINYQDGTQEYYKFHEGVNKIERLNSSRESFPGALNKHNYLSKSI